MARRRVIAYATAETITELRDLFAARSLKAQSPPISYT